MASNGLIDCATIAWRHGHQVPTATSGTYFYGGATAAAGVFLVESDTAGLVTGNTQDGNTVTQYVAVGSVTRFALVSIDLAVTRTGGMTSANLVAGKV